MGFPGRGLASYLCQNGTKGYEDSKGLAAFVSSDAH